MINSSPFTRFRYEVLFMAFILFLVGRIGHNFFWSSFLAPMVGMASESKPLLTVDFYIPALIFLVIWSGFLVTMFTWKLRSGLTKRVQQFAQSMAESRLLHGLFPNLESTCQSVQQDSQTLTSLLDQTESFRHNLADTTFGFLGHRRENS